MRYNFCQRVIVGFFFCLFNFDLYRSDCMEASGIRTMQEAVYQEGEVSVQEVEFRAKVRQCHCAAHTVYQVCNTDNDS